MKFVIIFFFFASTSYGQYIEMLDPVTNKVTKVYLESMNMPYKTALDVLNECNKRIDKSPQDWQAYYQRSRSQQILSNYKASIEDTDILIENKKLLNLAYWNQGLSYICLLDYTKAIEVYKKALNYYNDPYAKARIIFLLGCVIYK